MTKTTTTNTAKRFAIPAQPGMKIVAEWTSAAGHPVCRREPVTLAEARLADLAEQHATMDREAEVAWGAGR